jgi:hypothetical protein
LPFGFAAFAFVPSSLFFVLFLAGDMGFCCWTSEDGPGLVAPRVDIASLLRMRRSAGGT